MQTYRSGELAIAIPQVLSHQTARHLIVVRAALAIRRAER
jgi:hypothetical protein